MVEISPIAPAVSVWLPGPPVTSPRRLRGRGASRSSRATRPVDQNPDLASSDLGLLPGASRLLKPLCRLCDQGGEPAQVAIPWLVSAPDEEDD
jgi:hypothetical protein